MFPRDAKQTNDSGGDLTAAANRNITAIRDAQVKYSVKYRLLVDICRHEMS